MFANPEVSDFINRLIGGPTPVSRAPPPSPAYRGALARALLGDVTMPRIEGSFQAPPIEAYRRGLTPQMPTEGVNRGLGAQNVQELQGISGGGGNTGAGALTAGLGKLGAGIETALKEVAAKRAQQQAYTAALNSAPPRPAPFGSPPRPAPFGSSPGGAGGAVQTAPTGFNPGAAFSPIGAANTSPIFAQPGTGSGPVGGSIGAAGSLPFMAQTGGTGTGAGGSGAGSRSWRNNNPGNLEYGDFARAHGATGTDGHFAIFPSVQAGTDAQRALLFNSDAYRNLTLPQAISKWAPGSENNVPAYVSAMGGDTSGRKMGDYSPAEQDALLGSMRIHEGWVPGAGSGQPAVSLNSYAAGAPQPPVSPSASMQAGGPTLIAPWQPQTGPAYSDETWNNRPQYDYGAAPQPPLINGGQPGVYPMPGQPQGMNDVPPINPLAAALAGQGDPNAPPMMSPGIVAMLSGDLFGGFGGGQFGAG